MSVNPWSEFKDITQLHSWKKTMQTTVEAGFQAEWNTSKQATSIRLCSFHIAVWQSRQSSCFVFVFFCFLFFLVGCFFFFFFKSEKIQRSSYNCIQPIPAYCTDNRKTAWVTIRFRKKCKFMSNDTMHKVTLWIFFSFFSPPSGDFWHGDCLTSLLLQLLSHFAEITLSQGCLSCSSRTQTITVYSNLKHKCHPFNPVASRTLKKMLPQELMTYIIVLIRKTCPRNESE